MLLDMDSKSVLSHEEQGWVEELMEILYEADDLLDEVITTAKMKELNKGDDSEGLFKKVIHEVGGVSSIEEQLGGQLKDLKSLSKLRGEIWIAIEGNLPSENGNASEDYYIKHIENLRVVTLRIYADDYVTNQVIAKLQPSQYLMQLRLEGYNGIEIPGWGRVVDDWTSILPNLVKIKLEWCKRLIGIPLLSNLKHLKFLSLSNLHNLEYVETGVISDCSSTSKDIPFFPSLEYLQIWSSERLKGWRGGVGESEGGGSSSSSKSHWLPPFPRLLTLRIGACPELIYFPPCPSLESLEVWESNKLLRISPREGHGNLDIKSCSSLKNLKIDKCTSMTSVLGGALEHLTALESLSLDGNYAEVDLDDIPWSFLPQNLRSLELGSFITMKILPTGMKHLTGLQNLTINCCKLLEGLPEWISCLSSLRSLTLQHCRRLKSLGTIQNITSFQKLNIKDCPTLWRECQKPSGTEWPKIRHIPHICFLDW